HPDGSARLGGVRRGFNRRGRGTRDGREGSRRPKPRQEHRAGHQRGAQQRRPRPDFLLLAEPGVEIGGELSSRRVTLGGSVGGRALEDAPEAAWNGVGGGIRGWVDAAVAAGRAVGSSPGGGERGALAGKGFV